MKDRTRRRDWVFAAVMALIYLTVGLDVQGITNSDTGWFIIGPMGVILTVAAALGRWPQARPSIRTGRTRPNVISPGADFTVVVVLICLLAGGAIYGTVAHWERDRPFSTLLLVAAVLQVGLAAYVIRAATMRRHRRERADPRASER